MQACVCVCACADLCRLLKPGFVRLGAGRGKILAVVQRTLSGNEEDKTLAVPFAELSRFS